MKRKIRATGEEIVIPRKPGVLSAEDNQKVVRHHTELQFKLLSKFGDQQKDCGIRHLGWLDTAGDLMSFLRGENNVVQVFSSHDETVIKQRHYKEMEEIRGLHALN